MKAAILVFSLILAGKTVSSAHSVETCIEEYAKCVVPVIYNDACRVVVPVTECIRRISKDCEIQQQPVLEVFVDLYIETCKTGQTYDWMATILCVTNNRLSFIECALDRPEDDSKVLSYVMKCISSKMHKNCGKLALKLCDKFSVAIEAVAEGHSGNNTEVCLDKHRAELLTCALETDFNTLGDLFSFFTGFAHCLWKNAEEICGDSAKKDLQRYTEFIVFGTELLKNIDAISRLHMLEYQKHILKCFVNVFNMGEFSKCLGLHYYVNCLADAFRGHFEVGNPIVEILEKYQKILPILCDENSVFFEYMEKEADCMMETMQEIFLTCYVNLRIERFMGHSYTDTRPIANFLDCLSETLGEECSAEAEDIANELLDPLREVLDGIHLYKLRRQKTITWHTKTEDHISV